VEEFVHSHLVLNKSKEVVKN